MRSSTLIDTDFLFMLGSLLISTFDKFYSAAVYFRFDGSDERRKSGFPGRKDSDEEEEEEKPATRVGGVAIAPPPSLQEPTPASDSPRSSATPVSGDKYGLSFGGSVAAKIMAKYGFKVRGSELGCLNVLFRL
jgi:hypothetical protein